jgi:hypothetical protein
MSDGRFKINSAGIRAMLKSAEVASAVSDSARGKMASLPDGYKMSLHYFQKRSAVYIYPATKEAKRDAWENHRLTKML